MALNLSAFGKTTSPTKSVVYPTVATYQGKPSLALKPITTQATIKARPEPESPFGFLGDMIKGAFQGVKGMIESTANLNTKAVESLFSANKETVERAKLNPLAPQYLKKQSTPLKRAIDLGVAGVSTATTLTPAFQIFTAELEAAKKLPGPAKIPAVALSKGLEKLGQLGSYGLNKGIDVLPVKDETKTAMRPIADEIAPLVAMMVGMKLVGKATGGITGKMGERPAVKALNFGAKLTLQPFSTAYGLVNARVAFKVAERQQKGVEITPEVGRQIVNEVKQEIQTQGLPDIQPDGSIKPQEAITEAIKPKTTKVSPEAVKPEIDPLIQEARKYKSAEEFVKAVKDKDIIVGKQRGMIRTQVYSARQHLAKKDLKTSFNLEHNAKIASREMKKIKEDIKSLKDLGVKDSDKTVKNLQEKLVEKTKEWKEISAKYWKARKEESYVRKYGERDFESQLTDIWNKAQEITPEQPKISGVAKSIEANAIENKLITGVDKLSEYDARNFKAEAEKTADLINTDIEKARRQVRGEEPTDIRAGALIAGMEEYAKQHPSEAPDIIQELANSPLNATISVGASETSFARMRGVTAELADVKKSYESKVKDLPKKKSQMTKELKAETEKFNLTKEERSFSNFLDKITC